MRTEDEILAEVKLLTNQARFNKYLSPLDQAGIRYACNALMWVLGGDEAGYLAEPPSRMAPPSPPKDDPAP